MKSSRVVSLLESGDLREALISLHDTGYVEHDVLFDTHRNEDYVHRKRGVTRSAFVDKYRDFIKLCKTKHLPQDVSRG